MTYSETLMVNFRVLYKTKLYPGDMKVQMSLSDRDLPRIALVAASVMEDERIIMKRIDFESLLDRDKQYK